MIVYDTREKGKLPAMMEKEFGGHMLRKALNAGDVLIQSDDKNIIIEISTSSDFISKIISGRLWKQAEKCLDASPDVYFIIENTKYELAFSRKSYIGAMLSLTRLGIHVIQTHTKGDTMHVIRYLYNKYHTDKGSLQWGRKKPKGLSNSRQAEYMLMGVVGLGPKTATELLDRYGTLEKLIRAVLRGDLPDRWQDKLRAILTAERG